MILAFVIPTSALAVAPLLPDLIPDPAQRLEYVVDESSGMPHLLLRFDGFIHNVGPGVLEIRGSDPVSVGDTVEMSDVHQRLYYGPWPEGPYADVRTGRPPILYYETTEGHFHWHLQDAVSYELVNPLTGDSFDYSKHRQGFCFLDIQNAGPQLSSPYYTANQNNFCEQRRPDALQLTMGLLPGWRDRYHRGVTGQFVDVTVAEAGFYSLVARPDPSNVISEQDESNNTASADQSVSVTVPGYAAQWSYARTTISTPTTVQLRSEAFTSDIEGAEPPGRPEFTVTGLPAHGQLGQPAGTWLPQDAVVYIPDPGFTGRDSFTFAVRDHDHPTVPRFPSIATATVLVVNSP
jgi:hypothetical protein